MSILHIPPSFDKPHLIKNYKNEKGREEQHRIFVRHGSTTRLANKYDIDFMNYDKKNLVPEYRINLSSYVDGWYLKPITVGRGVAQSQTELRLNLILKIQDKGQLLLVR